MHPPLKSFKTCSSGQKTQNSLVVLLSVQVSPAQLGEKTTTKKYPTPYIFSMFYNIGQSEIQIQHQLFQTLLSETRTGGLEEEGQKTKQKEAVLPTTSSFFDVAGSKYHHHYHHPPSTSLLLTIANGSTGCLPNFCTFKAVRKHQYHCSLIQLLS